MMYRIRTISTGVAGAPFFTNIYYDQATGSAAQCAERVRLFWDSLRLVTKNGLVHQVQADVAVVNPADGDVEGIESVAVAPVNGGAAGDLLPTFTQGLGRLLTDGVVRGRRVQGRIFIPGFTEEQSQSGVPTGTGITAALLLLRDPGTGARPVVWSRPKEITGPVVVPGSQHQVTGFAASPRWAVLRSRR